jgi:MerR family transcriptional regulator/heat shock protein HspR
MGSRERRTVEVTIDDDQGVFMISVAAELADMHPQTLRIYESRGLIEPKRSPKNTRLYSQRDVELLRRIQRLTTEQGLNLAGVVAVLEMEAKLERAKKELDRTRRRAAQLERELLRARSSMKAELVPYGVYDVVPVRTRRAR